MKLVEEIKIRDEDLRILILNSQFKIHNFFEWNDLYMSVENLKM